jgi:NADPH-dependent 2,4-dienoyl-CoA reductase/sulfur reductase-like enzyme
MAAGGTAAGSGRRVAIVDENPTPGGQIWRGGQAQADSRQAAAWFRRAEGAGVEFLAATQVVAQPHAGVLLAETAGEARDLEYEKLIIATGARELLLPFPGWTLPNVTGVGGLQSLVKSGLPIAGKKVAVAGSGPLLLAVAAFLRKHGADVQLIAEQAPLKPIARFGLGLFGHPAKLVQGIGYKLGLLGVRYVTSCWPARADGDRQLESVTFRTPHKEWTVPCDYLACGFGFVPNLELASLVGCDIRHDSVQVDPWQETSIPGVYCAGEPTGIGGVDLALVEGQIAGYAAVGKKNEAAGLQGDKEKCLRFAGSLDRAFALRDELRELATPETIVCRCEDVTRGRLEPYESWRAAKLQTRCGMGPCQGRVCGAATDFLFGWKHESIRPPILPTRVENLARSGTLSAESDT